MSVCMNVHTGVRRNACGYGQCAHTEPSIAHRYVCMMRLQPGPAPLGEEKGVHNTTGHLHDCGQNTGSQSRQ
eukprot:48260-Eustigmatos_ZCMA.PRE.1